MQMLIGAVLLFVEVAAPPVPEGDVTMAEDRDGRIFLEIENPSGATLMTLSGDKFVSPHDAGVAMDETHVHVSGRRDAVLKPGAADPLILEPVVRDQHGNGWKLKSAEQDNRKELVLLKKPVSEPGHRKGDVRTLARGEWRAIVTGDWGYVWVGGREGVICVDPRKTEEPASWSRSVTGLGLSSRGLPLCGTADGHLYALDIGASGQIKHSRVKSRGLPDGAVRAVMTATDGTTWVVAGDKVYRAKPTRDAWQGDWQRLKSMPWGNHDIFGAVSNGDLYVGGGMASHGFPAEYTFFDEIFRYRHRDDEWSVVGRMATPRCYAGTVQMGGDIWVVGGFFKVKGKRVPTDRVEIYDPESGTITRGPDLHRPRAEPVVVNLRGRIYVVGGAGDKKEFRSMVSTGTGQKEWQPEEPAPGRVRQATGCVAGGKIYVFTGRHKAFCYDPDSSEWAELPAPGKTAAVPRAALCTGYEGEVWVMGGWDTKTPGATWIYNPDDSKWRRGPDLPKPTGWGAAGEINDRLVIAGGARHSKQHGYFIFSDEVYMLRE